MKYIQAVYDTNSLHSLTKLKLIYSNWIKQNKAFPVVVLF